MNVNDRNLLKITTQQLPESEDTKGKTRFKRLEKNRIGFEALTNDKNFLSLCKNLEKFEYIEDNASINLDFIRNCPKLKILVLWSNNKIFEFLSDCKNLKYLDLWCEELTLEDLKHLNNGNLEVLNIRNCKKVELNSKNVASIQSAKKVIKPF